MRFLALRRGPSRLAGGALPLALAGCGKGKGADAASAAAEVGVTTVAARTVRLADVFNGRRRSGRCGRAEAARERLSAARRVRGRRCARARRGAARHRSAPIPDRARQGERAIAARPRGGGPRAGAARARAHARRRARDVARGARQRARRRCAGARGPARGQGRRRRSVPARCVDKRKSARRPASRIIGDRARRPFGARPAAGCETVHKNSFSRYNCAPAQVAKLVDALS